MSAPSYPAPAGSDQELHEYIAGCLDGASRIAGAGVTYAEMGMDDSVHRTVLQLASYVRDAAETLAMLKELRAKRARRQEPEAA